ncbi:hypothetical protein [Rhodospira trueperi]|uniref:Uncharacterized protein n=1 Tax=Rhodospira trueperi TaxID=69960 RepID=A0A1G7BLS1_9PROT|nr:hypothetical protein [Rhodospira trueperi]SDE27862.1 hypothetical protein SAMN05421720_10586 [Rhodospira trueperi]
MRHDLLDEIERLVFAIRDFHARHGRSIARRIKRSSKARPRLDELRAFFDPIPEDYAALYTVFDGVRQPDTMSQWQSAVFLGHHWDPIDWVIRGMRIMRIEQQRHGFERLPAFRGSATRGSVDFDVFPTWVENGQAPVVANLGSLSPRLFIAFDSVLAMLRSIVAAQEAGVIRFRAQDDEDGHEGETLFDPGALWDVIAPLNPRADYWRTLRAGPIDWQLDPIKDKPAGGVVPLDPEVRRLIWGDPEASWTKADEEMRGSGMTEEPDRPDREPPPDGLA